MSWLVHSFGKFSIAAWYGRLVDIPKHWGLCDGTNGTPDLRDRFVPGAGDTYAQKETGGAAIHDHVCDTDGHDHDLAGGTDITVGFGYRGFPSTNPIQVVTDTATNHPPFRSLYYIMRVE